MWFIITKILFIVVLYVSSNIGYSSERVYVVQDKRNAFEVIKKLSRDYSFIMVVKTELPSGVRFKLVELYKGLLVWNTKIISKKISLNDIDENDLIAGEFIVRLEEDIPSTTPIINRDDAINLATRDNKDSNIKNINTQLLIKSYEGVAKLVYLIDYFIDETLPRRPFYFIAADTGEVFEKWEGLPT